MTERLPISLDVLGFPSTHLRERAVSARYALRIARAAAIWKHVSTRRV
jgi:hypothetical protein